jgi:tetratricopeptide (TPR) repeat protein
MLEVLRQLGAPESVVRPVREGVPAASDHAWAFLNGPHAAGRRWLLIFDNADDPAVLAAHESSSPGDHVGWLRSDPSGVVLVTTRVKDPRVWGSGIALRELVPLDETTAAKVLADLAPGIADPGGHEARALGRRLGGLPLVLHLAGSYLASPFARWHTFAEYRRALDGVELPDALNDLDDLAGQARTTIQRTWDLSLDAMAAGGCTQARPLLLLLSCYAPATPIPATLIQAEPLRQLLGLSGQAASDTSNNPPPVQRRLREGLRSLATAGLIDAISVDAVGEEAVMVHPVVADVNRARLLTTAKDDLAPISQAAVLMSQAATANLAADRPADWPAWRRVIPHLSALLDWLPAHLDTAVLTDLLTVGNAATEALRLSGNNAAAEDLARASVAAGGRLGDEHSVFLIARCRLAQALGDQAHDEAAAEICRDLLPRMRRALGDDHPATLATRQILAEMTDYLGRYSEAEAMFMQLIADQVRVLGAEDPATLRTHVRLARMLGGLGRHREGLQICGDVLTRQTAALSEDHPDVLFTRHNFACIQEAAGRDKEAEELLRLVVADRSRVIGGDHPTTLSTRVRLAHVILKQGRYKEAERTLYQVQIDRQGILHDTHPTVMDARLLQALIAAEHGHYADAEQMCHEVAQNYRLAMGEGHPWNHGARNNLAWIIAQQGRYEEAESLLTEVLADQQRLLPPDHPSIFLSCYRLALIAAKRKRFHEAGELCRRALAGRQRVLGDDHPDTLIARKTLAGIAAEGRPEPRPPSRTARN